MVVHIARMRHEGEELLVIELPASTHARAPSASLAALTPTERAIAAALLRGDSTAEIAAARRRSTRTIGNQVSSLFRKLGVHSRVEMAMMLASSWSAKRPG